MRHSTTRLTATDSDQLTTRLLEMEAASASGHKAPRSPPMLPSLKKFLESLPEIRPEDLPEDHKNCDICMEQYTAEVGAEKPVSLSCGHVFGSICIEAWVASSQVSRPTCPMCRAVLTSPSSIQRWEHLATLMQQQPCPSLSQTPRRTGASAAGGHGSAVELVSLFFHVVMQMLAHHRRHRMPASALLLRSAQAVASRMGHLYVLLGPAMDDVGVAVPWAERGPNVVAILDLKQRRMLEGTLEKLAQTERRVLSEEAVNI